LILVDECLILADECLIFVDELIRVVTQHLMLYRVPTDLEVVMQILVGILMEGKEGRLLHCRFNFYPHSPCLL
jgi:hypothetical protein